MLHSCNTLKVNVTYTDVFKRLFYLLLLYPNKIVNINGDTEFIFHAKVSSFEQFYTFIAKINLINFVK